MSFKELRNLSETPEQKAKAAEGFEARFAKHEKRFAEEALQLEPSDKFLERSYDI